MVHQVASDAGQILMTEYRDRQMMAVRDYMELGVGRSG